MGGKHRVTSHVPRFEAAPSKQRGWYVIDQWTEMLVTPAVPQELAETIATMLNRSNDREVISEEGNA
jgi:hypothetical protein